MYKDRCSALRHLRKQNRGEFRYTPLFDRWFKLLRRLSEVYWSKPIADLLYSFFLRVTGFVKTVSIMRLRLRLMPEAGTSPSLVLFCVRGCGSAGLGRGEIRSTSTTGGGSEKPLDLRVEKKEKLYEGKRFYTAWGSRNCGFEKKKLWLRKVWSPLKVLLQCGSYLAARLPVFLVLETTAAFSSSTWSSEATSSWEKKRKNQNV